MIDQLKNMIIQVRNELSTELKALNKRIVILENLLADKKNDRGKPKKAKPPEKGGRKKGE